MSRAGSESPSGRVWLPGPTTACSSAPRRVWCLPWLSWWDGWSTVAPGADRTRVGQPGGRRAPEPPARTALPAADSPSSTCARRWRASVHRRRRDRQPRSEDRRRRARGALCADSATPAGRPACARDTRTSRRPNPAFRRSPRQTGASSRLLELRICDRATSRSWVLRPTPTAPPAPAADRSAPHTTTSVSRSRTRFCCADGPPVGRVRRDLRATPDEILRPRASNGPLAEALDRKCRGLLASPSLIAFTHGGSPSWSRA